MHEQKSIHDHSFIRIIESLKLDSSMYLVVRASNTDKLQLKIGNKKIENVSFLAIGFS